MDVEITHGLRLNGFADSEIANSLICFHSGNFARRIAFQLHSIPGDVARIKVCILIYKTDANLGLG